MSATPKTPSSSPAVLDKTCDVDDVSRPSRDRDGRMNRDGFYYRDRKSDALVGPMSKTDFEAVSVDAYDADKSFRSSNGHVFRVVARSRLSLSKAWSGSSCGHACEWCALVAMVLMTLAVASLIDWRKEDEKDHFGVLFVCALGLITLVFVAYTLRTVFRRWRKTSHEVRFVEEV